MASGKITNKNTISGSIKSNGVLNASVASGGGTTDHSRLTNRAAADQHPIEAITDLRKTLDSKLEASTALPLINEALEGKAKGLYFDAKKELARKSYWYLTSEIDPVSKQGTKESIISGPYNLGAGGGGSGTGGGAGITTVTVQTIDWPTAVVVGNSQIKTDLKIKWSSSKEGTPITEVGTVYVRINGTQVKVLANKNPGDVIIEDITSYSAFAIQDNKIEVEVMDIYGSTMKVIRTIKGVSLKLSSNFVAGATPFINGDINYTYIPEGDAEKTVYFEIDGVPQIPVITKVSKVEAAPYQIRGLSHGSHTLKVYFTANIGGQDVPSNTLFYDLICVDPNNPTPIIASDFTALNQNQYSSFEIPYYVYANGRTILPVTLKATSSEGEIVSSTQGTVGKRLSWPYRADSAGIHTLEISCENAKPKRFEISVAKTTIPVAPVPDNVALALSAHNRKNDDVATRESWTYTTDDIEPITYNCKFENFNWSSNGWVFKPEDQTSVLRVGAGAKVTIPLQLFGDHAKGADGITNAGRTIELDFSTHSIRNYDTSIISCLDQVASDFYEIEESFEQGETRKEGFEVIYDYKSLNEALPCSEQKQSVVFTYKNESWVNEDNITINLTDYGLTLEPKDINPSGENLGKAIEGDKIIIKYSKEHQGLQVTPKLASLRSLKSYLEAAYKEDEHVRITFVIEPEIKENSNIKHQIIWVYINGVASAALNYPDGDSFIHKQAQEIEIGSTEAVVDIYNIRIYKTALTPKQIVNNWIADTPAMATRTARFERNAILNSSDEIVYDALPEELPYIIWGIDRLPTSKNDIRYGTAEFVDPTNSARNFTAIDGEYKVQGTSSALYPTKNIRLRLRKGKGGPNLEWFDNEGNDLLLANGGKGFPITYPDGIGVDYFTFKVDFASSEGANNVELTKLYNDASKKYGILTPPQKYQPSNSDYKADQIRVGIDGFPIAVFYKDSTEKISFHTKANFNNDKANEDVYGFADGDESWETTNNSADVAKYKVELTADNWKDGFEGRFPEDNTEISKLKRMVDWVYSTYRAKATGEKLESEVSFTYKDVKQSNAGKVNTTIVKKTFEYDTAEYRLAKFKAELKDYFNVDSCLFYYLFTELFLMIDSRAKNAFPTYFATRTTELVKDDDGNEIPNTYADGGNRWYWIPYDMDTALGIDNKGKLVFDYNLEDIDTIEDGSAVYNGQDSVMWCNIRDAFAGELAVMYNTLRSQDLISYNEVDNRFTEHQSKWPEVLLNIDAYNKYVTPLPGADYLAMLQGTKEQQRKWWLYNRFKYIDSKYNSGDAAADEISFRTYIKAGQEKPDIKVVPYASIYASVSYANGRDLVTARAKSRDVEVTLPNPFGINEIYTDQEVAIYSASQLKSIGDLAGFYLDTLDISDATRLQELKVGDDGTKYPNYKNPYLKTLMVGNNDLLRVIDARNCSGLGTTGAGRTPSPDLSGCPNIEEIYFTGTKINGIKLPDGGTIKKLHLPGTLTSLKLQNQPLLEELYLDTLRTITRSVGTGQDEYSFNGIVVDRGGWDEELNANADIYLADSTDPSSPIIKVSIANKQIYDLIVENEEKNLPTLLNITCKYIDVQYDLVTNEEDNTESVQLGEYLTRQIKQLEQITTLESTKTIANLVGSISNKIDVPKVAEYKVTSFEELWLENLPSSVIKARDFVTNMRRPTSEDPSKTGIYITGINETFADFSEIELFYDLLDQHCGIDVTGSGTKPEKAQVAGVIHINTPIPYRKYAELTARYPEVKIDAPQIIGIITLIENELDLPKVFTVNLGSTDTLGTTIDLSDIIPIKESTQVHEYTFANWQYNDGRIWTSEDIISSDTTLTAIYTEEVRKYTAIFNPNSDVISVSPAQVTQFYGTKLTAPEVGNIPEGVSLEGWFKSTGEAWDFDNFELVDHTTLTAKWKDANKPTVQLFVEDFNYFRYEASDNLGIVGWAHTVNNEEPIWNELVSTTNLVGNCEVTEPGINTFWIIDSNGNTAKASITAYNIDVTVDTENDDANVVSYKIYEEGFEEKVINNVALANTKLKLTATIDSHYENLVMSINNNILSEENSYTINSDIEVLFKCSPKVYKLYFNLNSKGTYIAPQEVIYRTLGTKPLDQYYQQTSEVIHSWYKDTNYTELWDFTKDIVLGETILYAKWAPYHEPSIFTIIIPEDAEANTEGRYEIEVDFTHGTATQEADLVKVDFGDGVKRTDNRTSPVHLRYEYDSPGEKIIKIYGNNKGYSLGNNYDYQIINPCKYLVKAELAWDLPKLTHYSFKGASITEFPLTEYLTSVAIGAFAACNKVNKLELPLSITTLEDNAFEACEGLEGIITLPKSLTRMGNYVFNRCSNITGINFECTELSSLGEWVFSSCSNLTEIEIPEFITSIGNNCFSFCTNLSKLKFTNPNLRVGSYSIQGCTGLQTAGPIGSADSGGYPVNLEFAWKYGIPAFAFAAGQNQSYLIECILPDTLKTIGDSAFMNTRLKTIDLPYGLTAIEQKAFVFSTLSTIAVPVSVQDIGVQVFGGCNALQDVKIYTTNTKTMINTANDSWFAGSNMNLCIQIPESIVDKPSLIYGTHWNYFSAELPLDYKAIKD